MPMESILSRQLDITFLHARELVTEARLQLGIEGYPDSGQVANIVEEAIIIFEHRTSPELQAEMRETKSRLDAVKMASCGGLNGSMPMKRGSSSSLASSQLSAKNDLFTSSIVEDKDEGNRDRRRDWPFTTFQNR